jgi:hypothetical protein
MGRDHFGQVDINGRISLTEMDLREGRLFSNWIGIR